MPEESDTLLLYKGHIVNIIDSAKGLEYTALRASVCFNGPGFAEPPTLLGLQQDGPPDIPLEKGSLLYVPYAEKGHKNAPKRILNLLDKFRSNFKKSFSRWAFSGKIDFDKPRQKAQLKQYGENCTEAVLLCHKAANHPETPAIQIPGDVSPILALE